MPVPVLVAEDDESVSLTLCAILGRAGYRPYAAVNLADALKQLEIGDFGAAIIDLCLGPDDGLEVLERLKAVSPNTVAIVLTGFGSIDSATRALRLGADDYLLKPCPAEELAGAIERARERRARVPRRRAQPAALGETAIVPGPPIPTTMSPVDEALAPTGRDLAALIAERSFLARVSDTLAGSLNLDETLDHFAHLVVPEIADWCLVELTASDAPGERPGSARRVAVVAADPAKQDLARALSSTGNQEPAEPAVPVGGAVLFPEVAVADLDGGSDGRWRLLAAIGARSAVLVPLVARGQTLGTLALIAAESGRRYGDADLQLARELSWRTAQAIDNARLYEAERAAVRARDDFLSVAAHELKTPLTGLQGTAQLLLRSLNREGLVDLDRLQARLAVIDRQSRRLATLVDQLLDVSRIQGGRLALALTETDIVALVEGVAEYGRARAGLHQLVVSADGPAVARVDPIRLEQVIVNLVDNAIKFSPEGGSVRLGVSHPAPGTVEISVSDPGIGIPPEQRERVFDRFYQVRGDSRPAGLGLGLYISRQIVELHGGTISAQPLPDRGTRLVVRLPV